VQSVRLHLDVCCRCATATASGDAIVLGCADAVLRIYTFYAGHGATLSQECKAQQAAHECTVRCIGGAPSVICCVPNVHGFVTIEHVPCGIAALHAQTCVSAVATTAQLYLRCWDAARPSCDLLTPQRVHLPLVTSCRADIWRCHSSAAPISYHLQTGTADLRNLSPSATACPCPASSNSATRPLCVSIPTNRTAVTCAAVSTITRKLILAGAGELLIYDVGFCKNLATTDEATAGIAVYIDLRSTVRLSMVPRSVDMGEHFVAIAFANDVLVLRMCSATIMHPTPMSSISAVVRPRSGDHLNLDNSIGHRRAFASRMSCRLETENERRRLLTLPNVPSTLLTSVPFHDPLEADKSSSILPSLQQQPQLTQCNQATESCVDSHGGKELGWGWLRCETSHVDTALPISYVLCGRRLRSTRLDWIYHGRFDLFAGLHTVSLVHCASIVPFDEGLGCKEDSARCHMWRTRRHAGAGLARPLKRVDRARSLKRVDRKHEETGTHWRQMLAPECRRFHVVVLVVGVLEARLLDIRIDELGVSQCSVISW